MTETLLLSVDPARNRYRFFRLELEAREGRVSLHRRWGRIGTEGRHLVEDYASREAATAARETLIALRARRGYVEATDEDLREALRLMAHQRAFCRTPRQLQFPVAVGF